ncbi:hypothetical protein C8R43DRAFT_1117899 [Mycena crocata]|nr:hypothetical protein C8R43DRAFT_1117899 [Mycena crocata]
MHISLLLFLAVPLRVIACEGECITNTTNAMCKRYESPVRCVVEQIGQQIINRLHLVPQPGSPPLSPDSLLSPLIDDYRKRRFAALESTIFPGFFHGKCQNPTTGVEPEGCPNPDCPVVCGTPGSICHFYDIFAQLAFNATQQTLVSCASPDSPSYRTLEENVSQHREQSEMGPRALRYTRSRNFVPVLRSILDQMPDVLVGCCGGSELPHCRWTTAMKAYILTFP